jgi:phosphatidylserine decarboxylase
MLIAREGWLYIVLLLAVGVLVAWRWPLPGAVVLALALFVAFFFRDPERRIPTDAGAVVSPADGKVVRIQPAGESSPLGPDALQVSIFLSIFNVHVNRAPVAGRIVDVKYQPGSFLPAFDHEASHRNEQNVVRLEGRQGTVVFAQIAGLIARRIVFRKRVGDEVARGERVGMIKFGSRTDLFLPATADLKVKVGDHVSGGSTIIALMAEAER